MQTRAEQKEATRERIVDAAVQAFADYGFRGASTREIAKRAGTNQGLITYHFQSKDDLWEAAADRIFSELRASLMERLGELDPDDPRGLVRETVREFVRFAAAHPELFRIMIEEGKHAGERMSWIVDNHVRPLFELGFLPGRPFATLFEPSLLPHVYYVLAGAGSLIFAVAPECKRLTGLDPTREHAIEAHASLVADLLVPAD